jgi:hypothetical protein
MWSSAAGMVCGWLDIELLSARAHRFFPDAGANKASAW